jgi:hypothetical protein
VVFVQNVTKRGLDKTTNVFLRTKTGSENVENLYV